MHPILVRLGVFHLFWQKRWKMHPNFVSLDALKMIIEKKKYFPTDQPKFPEILLEGNTAIFFFGIIVTVEAP